MTSPTIDRTLARVRVVLSAAVTYLVLAAFVFGAITEELSAAFPDHPITRWVSLTLTAAIGVIGVAVLIIRRVTPVLPEQRGVLPPPPPPPNPPAGTLPE